MSGTMPSEKQIRYVMYLLASRGYPTRFMNAQYKGLATMRQRSGTVEAWLRSQNFTEISSLIDKLKEMPEKPKA